MYGNDKENGMRFFKSLVISLLFIPILVSCPIEPIFDNMDFLGVQIYNYPSWVNVENVDIKTYAGEATLAYSPWLDWQTEGKELQRFVSAIGSVNSKDYQGKFRLIMNCQTLIVGFNDKDSSSFKFFCYIAPIDMTNIAEYFDAKFLAISPTFDENIFSYDCWFREYATNRFLDEKTNANYAKITLKRINNSNQFNYLLSIGGKKVVDTVMSAVSQKEIAKANLGREISWIPVRFNEIIGNSSTSRNYYGRASLEFKLSDNNMLVSLKHQLNTLFCMEGITLREVDEEKRTVSFYLEDRNESDFADYIELVVGTEKPYGDETGKNSSLFSTNGTLTFYKEIEGMSPIVVRQYGKNNTKFSFRLPQKGAF